MYNGRFIVHIAGPGRCGKDTVAKALSEICNLRYKHSTSYGAAPFFYQSVLDGELEHEELDKNTYQNLEECFAARNESQYMRKVWSKYIDQMNRVSGTELYKLCIDNGNDILTGIRKVREITACLAQGIIDLNIWVCNRLDRQNEDSTQEYGPELCDFIFLNHQVDDLELAVRAIKRKLMNVVNISNVRLHGRHGYR